MWHQLLLGSLRASSVQGVSARLTNVGIDWTFWAMDRSCRTWGSLIRVARYVCSKHYSLKSHGMTTLALYTYGVYVDHKGKAKNKFYSSSTKIYSSLVYKRKGTFLTYFSFILPSTQPKRLKKTQTQADPQ